MQKQPAKVTIVGGGVAAIEAMIALRALAGDRVKLELVTPQPNWTYRPMVVAEPFGLGEAKRYDFVRIAQDHGAAMHLAGVESVDADAHRLITSDGRSLDYDLLLVAIGAVPVVSIPGSVTIKGPGYTSRFRTMLRELDEGRIHRVAFAVPGSSSWPLPLYELALMTAAHAEERGLSEVSLSIITPEPEPLALFGAEGSAAVRELLEQRGLEFRGGMRATEMRDRVLRIEGSDGIPVDRVVSLPRLRGPALPGLPCDTEGYIPTDEHGLVEGELDVYAAGDATTSPIKQGGIATQQADAAAEAIAARLGAPVEPRPFRPVLRGLLLTGDRPRFLRTDLEEGEGPSASSTDPLWWPPGKIAGRWLAPYLALHHDEVESAPAGLAIEVEVTSGARHRSVIARDDDGRTHVARIR